MGQPIDWVKLDLRHIPQLNRQVGQVENLYRQAQALDDKKTLEDIRSQIHVHITKVKEFALSQSEDPRAILLEKQAIRLKQIIQSITETSSTTAQNRRDSLSTPNLAWNDNNRNARGVASASKQFSANSKVSSKGVAVAQSKQPRKTSIYERPAWNVHAAQRRNHKVLESKDRESVSDSEFTDKADDIIYRWEASKSPSDSSYHSSATEKSSSVGSPVESDEASRTIARLTVRLSESDYKLLKAKQDIENTKRKNAARMQSFSNWNPNSCYLFASEEYQDNPSLALRVNNPESWVDPKGFRRIARESRIGS